MENIRKKQRQEGITLIALVVTIVVLLILAGTSIAMLTGDNGIITNAQKSQMENTKSEVIEKMNMAYNAAYSEARIKMATDAGYQPSAHIAELAGIVAKELEVTEETTDVPTEGINNGYHVYYKADGTTITMLYGDNKFSLGVDEEAQNNLYPNIKGEITLSTTQIMYAKQPTNSSKIDNNKNNDEKLKVSYTKDEGNDLWSNTVVLNTAIEGYETPNLTIEQKRELLAYIYDFNNYEEFEQWATDIYGDGYINLKENFDSEEELIDELIDYGKSFMDYSNIEKIEELGLKVFKIKTPYGILYTTNLDGNIKCTLKDNGKYNFEVSSGNKTVTQKVDINNIRKKSTGDKYDFKLTTISDGEIEYSTDDQNWSKIENNTLELSNVDKIYLRCVVGKGNPIVETSFFTKDEEFYKTFKSENEALSWQRVSYRMSFFNTYFFRSLLYSALVSHNFIVEPSTHMILNILAQAIISSDDNLKTLSINDATYTLNEIQRDFIEMVNKTYQSYIKNGVLDVTSTDELYQKYFDDENIREIVQGYDKSKATTGVTVFEPVIGTDNNNIFKYKIDLNKDTDMLAELFLTD